MHRHILAIRNAITCTEYAIEKIAVGADPEESDQAMLTVDELVHAREYLKSAMLILGEDVE